MVDRESLHAYLFAGTVCVSYGRPDAPTRRGPVRRRSGAGSGSSASGPRSARRCGINDAVEFAVLGPVEVRHDGHQLPAGSGRERLVLAALLLDAGRTTTADFLIGQLWEQPPPSAKAQLHNL